MSPSNLCVIWGTPAQFGEPDNANWSKITSPRAGGNYFRDTAAKAAVARWEDRKKVLLTDWLVEQRRLGVACPTITSQTLREIEWRQPPSVHDRAINLLRYLELKSSFLGDVIKFYDDARGIDGSHGYSTYELLAWSSSIQIAEVVTLAEYCSENKWISYQDSVRTNVEWAKALGQVPPPTITSNVIYELMLKPKGYAQLALLSGSNTRSSQCFVAMWFDDSMSTAYNDGIAPAIRDNGYEPLRIDKMEHIDRIDDRIIAEIRRSRFVVADFTSQPGNSRGGVYYEAGFAHGLNVPVIWTCRLDLISHVHFDTRQYMRIPVPGGHPFRRIADNVPVIADSF